MFWCWFFRYGGGGVFTAFAQHTLMMMFLGASKYTPLAITTGMLSANILEMWMIINMSMMILVIIVIMVLKIMNMSTTCSKTRV